MSVTARQLPYSSAGAEPERGSVMWNLILTAGSWGFFILMICFWARWSDRELEQFDNGDSRYLE